ncbi:Nst1p-like protein [Schistosoma mansoni]|uniref:Nst1p-like protein n=1 Tax=Schistosoma mansoni TaxID=6183 RepID=G4VK13_SCHMA|nr:Nst1p-like protein [Schistosoma mansoni]|eukprot:XP_018652623.1 Nst1p-like protein [Schistosoma mansoni]
MKKYSCLLEGTTFSDRNSGFVFTNESSGPSESFSTDLLAQFTLDKYSDQSDYSFSDDSNQYSSLLSYETTCDTQQGTVRDSDDHKSKLITRKECSGVSNVLSSHCASSLSNLARNRSNRTASSKCTPVFYEKQTDDSEKRRSGSCNFVFDDKGRITFSRQYECLCSLCFISRITKSEKYKTRNIRKQSKTVLDTDYHPVNLRRKVSTKQFNTSNGQTDNRSSSKVSLHGGCSPTSDLYNITECLISECVRDHLLIKPVIAKNDHNVTISSNSDAVNNAECLHNSNDKLSAWGCWLLEKEKQRREQRKQSKKKQIEEIQKRNQLLVQKINRRRFVEQKYKEWIEEKQKERIKIKKLLEIEKKNEESKKLQELLEHTQKSKLKYKEWCKKKTEEEYKKIEYIRQVEFKKHLANQTRKEASTVAYDHWLKSTGCKKSAPYYSHGYSDGKLIDYYDRTANPSPSFVNPNPWINPAD